MTCIFDRNVFDENVFDTCPLISSSGSQDFQISYPFVLKKMARGIILRYWFSGTLLRRIQKTFFFDGSLKRDKSLMYYLNGILTKRFEEQKEFFVSGALLRKEEHLLNMDSRILNYKVVLEEQARVKEIIETLDIINILDEI